MHCNQVQRDIVCTPKRLGVEQFRSLCYGSQGCVETESEWTVRRRERAEVRVLPLWNCPTQAKSGLEWATAVEGDQTAYCVIVIVIWLLVMPSRVAVMTVV